MEHITDPVLDVTLACPDCRLVGRDCACMPGEGEEPEDTYDHDPFGETL